jgi:large subunit ribosomal protein L10
MSKVVKGLVQKEIAKRLDGIDGVAVINPRGIDAIKNNQIRRRLRAKGVRMTVVKNTLAKRAVGDGKLKGFDALLDGPSAVIYGQASISAIARLVLDEKKTDEKIELRGIFYDGEIYVGDKGVEQVSKLPTPRRAIGQVVALILAPAPSSPARSRARPASRRADQGDRREGGQGRCGRPLAAPEAAPAA